MKYINIFLNNNSKIALTSLELDFNKAKRFKKNIIVGKQFTFYFVNGHTHILNNSQIVWVYSVMRSGKFQNCIIKFTDINKEQKQFAVSKATSKVLLHYYQETQPHMVVGNNRKTKKLYKKDFPGFLDLKYNKAMNNNIDDESEELIL